MSPVNVLDFVARELKGQIMTVSSLSAFVAAEKAADGIVRGNLLELSGVLVLASVDEKPIPIFQDVTRGYPLGGDDVYPLPPVAAASRGPAS